MEDLPNNSGMAYVQQPAKVGGFAPRRNFENQLPSCKSGQGLTNTPCEQFSSSGQNFPNVRTPKPKKEKFEANINAATDKLVVEESLRMHDANGLAMKTPVSILQELLSRRGITPSYELVQIEGAIHEPTFRYRVSFNDKEVPFTAMGAGRSKKEAKHSAARGLIDKLTGLQLPNSAQSNASQGEDSNGNQNPLAASDCSDKVVGNPIGWLQEMCMSRRWPPPTYETCEEVGLPHERLFTIACTILTFREVGKGKSKKIAKRYAAHKMWTRLQENPLDNNQISEVLQSGLEEEDRNNSNYYDELKDIHLPTLKTQHSAKVSQFHKTLKSAGGKKLEKLQKTCLRTPNINFIKLLADIANENQFEVTYVEIEEKTFKNQCQCLVQLSTLPVGVCHGSGMTTAEAQKNAAQNALEYLKIMTKK